jgi:hypothetical protein
LHQDILPDGKPYNDVVVKYLEDDTWREDINGPEQISDKSF